VALLTNKAGVIWIPKGHLKKGEDNITGAFREINEELGLKPETIKHLGFIAKDDYIWNVEGVQHHKELFIHSFYSLEKQDLSLQVDEDLLSADWYTTEEALKIITFNKDELIKAVDLLKDSF
jgi:8-oxo-dGTP pyrophosphatase MutT (NUDIX family)